MPSSTDVLVTLRGGKSMVHPDADALLVNATHGALAVDCSPARLAPSIGRPATATWTVRTAVALLIATTTSLPWRSSRNAVPCTSGSSLVASSRTAPRSIHHA